MYNTKNSRIDILRRKRVVKRTHSSTAVYVCATNSHMVVHNAAFFFGEKQQTSVKFGGSTNFVFVSKSVYNFSVGRTNKRINKIIYSRGQTQRRQIVQIHSFARRPEPCVRCSQPRVAD